MPPVLQVPRASKLPVEEVQRDRTQPHLRKQKQSPRIMLTKAGKVTRNQQTLQCCQHQQFEKHRSHQLLKHQKDLIEQQKHRGQATQSRFQSSKQQNHRFRQAKEFWFQLRKLTNQNHQKRQN